MATGAVKRLRAGLAAVLLALALPLAAETLAEAGGLVISGGEARSAGPAARSGAGYLAVTNSGAEPDRLLSIESPAAQRVEIHATIVEDGIARMRPVEGGLAVPPGETVLFEQGGHHLMFMGLTDAWDAEAGVPVTLVFERAGAVDLVLPVASGRGALHGGHAGGHGG